MKPKKFVFSVIFYMHTSNVNLFCMFISYSSEIDITGVSEMSVNNTSYTLQNDSVVLQHDRDKYACSEEDSDISASDGESDEPACTPQ